MNSPQAVLGPSEKTTNSEAGIDRFTASECPARELTSRSKSLTGKLSASDDCENGPPSGPGTSGPPVQSGPGTSGPPVQSGPVQSGPGTSGPPARDLARGRLDRHRPPPQPSSTAARASRNLFRDVVPRAGRTTAHGRGAHGRCRVPAAFRRCSLSPVRVGGYGRSRARGGHAAGVADAGLDCALVAVLRGPRAGTARTQRTDVATRRA